VEKDLLGADEIAGGYRLACQTRVKSDAKVSLPLTSLIDHPKITLEDTETEIPLDPPVEDYVAVLSSDKKDDSQSDEEKLVRALTLTYGKEVITVDPQVLLNFPSVKSENAGKVRVSVRDKEVISVRSPGKVPLGIAVDVGTTKLAGYLVDLETGGTVAAEGMVNPQRAYGEDVMSRISYAMEEGGAVLREVVIKGLNELIRNLCPEADSIVEVILAGNTAMHHLLLELPVKQLGLAPYQPSVWESPDIKAREIGLDVAPGAYVHFLPNVGGFIGGDHVAMILAAGIYTKDKTVMGIDIGTNTEIVLSHKGTLMSTSCASGPAFEGGHITHGMGAVRGAIEKVEILGVDSVSFHTIGNLPPLGVCGSGIVDSVAELCRRGVINRQGRLEDVPGVRQDGSTHEFVLVPGEQTGTGRDITITQKDINEIQLAKAAIRTGVDTLVEEAGINWEEIEEVVLAGGFGSSLNPASGLAIGMFPPFKGEQFKVMGNGAGAGSRLCLISRSERAKAKEIARKISCLELMTHSSFHTRFARAMFF
jgi:uncharacterized 2Fe-2S/4Fe-4S cluster protein (DUF4445 family)